MTSLRLKTLLEEEQAKLVSFPILKTIESKEALARLKQSGFTAAQFDEMLPDMGGGFKLVKYAPVKNIKVKISYHPEIKFDEKARTEPFELAYLYQTSDICPAAKIPENTRQAVLTTQKLLRDEKVPGDFNLLSLFHNQAGWIVFERGRRDLSNLELRNLSLSEITDLIADVVLGVYDLHSRNIVHRDIKFENVMVFYYNGHRILKLIDHDWAEKVDITNMFIGEASTRGTRECLAPEVIENDFDFYGLDLKAIDMYALGHMICVDLADQLHPELKSHVVSHFKGLMKKNLFARRTIENVLDNVFFGETPELRQQYFASRRKKAFRQIEFDGIPAFPPPAMNNPILLLDRTIKPIFQTVTDVAEEMAEMVRRPLIRRGSEIPDTLMKKMHRLQELSEEKFDPKYKQFVTRMVNTAKRDFASMQSVDNTPLMLAVNTALREFKATAPENIVATKTCFFSTIIPNPERTTADNFVSQLRQQLEQNGDVGLFIHEFLFIRNRSETISFQDRLIEQLRKMERDELEICGLQNIVRVLGSVDNSFARRFKTF